MSGRPTISTRPLGDDWYSAREKEEFDRREDEAQAALEVKRAAVDGDRVDAALAPTQFRWREVPPNLRPAGPMDEYYMTPYDIDHEEMLRRWIGLGKETEIWQLYRRPWFERNFERIMRVASLHLEEQDIFDPNTLEALNKRDFKQVYVLWELQLLRIAKGEEPTVRKKTDKDGNTVFYETWSPMNGRQLDFHTNALQKLFDMTRALSGQAKETVRTVDDAGATILDQMRSVAREMQKQNGNGSTVTVMEPPSGRELEGSLEE